MIAALDTRKVRLINVIASLDKSEVVEKVEQLLFAELSPAQLPALTALLQPMQEKTDLGEILRQQNYQGPDRQRFKKLVEALGIKEIGQKTVRHAQ